MDMKANRRNKYIVVALTGAIGVALVGSVAGTYAWYQYSTKATAHFLGTSASTTENLQLSLGINNTAETASVALWKSDLTPTDIVRYLEDHTTDPSVSIVTPITFGGFDKDAAIPPISPKANPLYQYNMLEKWEDAKTSDYVAFPITLRVRDGEGSLNKDRPVFLSDLTLKSTESGGRLADALRIQFSATDSASAKTNTLVSKNGDTLYTTGWLDVNGDGRYDRARYEGDDKTPLLYGEGTTISGETGVLTSFKAGDILVGDNGKGKIVTSGTSRSLGTIKADGYLTINVTIWLEGWQKYEGNTASAKDPYKVASAAVEAQKALMTSAHNDYVAAGSDESAKAAAQRKFDRAKQDYQNALWNVGYGRIGNLSGIQAAIHKSGDATLQAKADAYVAAIKTAYQNAVNTANGFVITGTDFSVAVDESGITSAKNVFHGVDVSADTKKSMLKTDFLQQMELADIGKSSSMWDVNLNHANFEVGMTFAIDTL